VTVAAGVLRTAPVETDLSFPPGTVVQVQIVIPAGVAGLGGFQLTNSGQPAIPYNTGAFFIGDDEIVTRDITGYNNSGRWGFRAFNEDVNAHTFQIRFSIVENDVHVPVETPSQPLAISPSGEPITVTPSPGGEPEGVSPGEAPPEPGQEEPPVEGEGPGAPPPKLGEGEGPPESPEGPPTPEGPGEAPPPAFGSEGEGEPEPEVGSLPGMSEPAAGEETPEGDLPTVVSSEAQPSSPGGKPHAKAPGKTVVKTIHLPAGGWLPAGARYTRERVDQGQDLITNWRGPIIAPGNGHVVRNLSDKAFPVGFGPHYAVVHIDTGPFAGHDWYIGHCTSAVGDGVKFKAGHVLAHADQGQREGGGWAEIGEAPGGAPGPMGNGAKWSHLFGTVSRRVTVKAAPHPGAHKPGGKRKPAPHGKPKGKAHGKAPTPHGAPKGGKRGHAPAPAHGHAPPHAGHPPAHGAPRPAGRPHAPAPRTPAPHAAPRPAPAPRRAPPPAPAHHAPPPPAHHAPPPPPPHRSPPPPPPPPPRRAPPPPPPPKRHR
jgi:hypothetical protein